MAASPPPNPLAPIKTLRQNLIMTCHFCKLDPAKHLASNGLAYAVADGFPVSPGHTLIVTQGPAYDDVGAQPVLVGRVSPEAKASFSPAV
jgi:hypothetical protein